MLSPRCQRESGMKVRKASDSVPSFLTFNAISTSLFAVTGLRSRMCQPPALRHMRESRWRAWTGSRLGRRRSSRLIHICCCHSTIPVSIVEHLPSKHLYCLHAPALPEHPSTSTSGSIVMGALIVCGLAAIVCRAGVVVIARGRGSFLSSQADLEELCRPECWCFFPVVMFPPVPGIFTGQPKSIMHTKTIERTNAIFFIQTTPVTFRAYFFELEPIHLHKISLILLESLFHSHPGSFRVSRPLSCLWQGRCVERVDEFRLALAPEADVRAPRLEVCAV